MECIDLEYAQNGCYDEALTLFQQMQNTNVNPHMATIVSILPACVELGNLQQHKDIHDYVIGNRFESDFTVHYSLIAMYSKWNAVDRAC